jgi:hypothetical protein
MKPYPNFRELESLSGITWSDLTTLEPRLGELLWRARQASVTCRRVSDVNGVFAPIQNTLAEMVGFTGKHHGHPVLGSPWAYQVAYWKLYDSVAGLLPSPVGGAAESSKKQKDPVADTNPSESEAACDHAEVIPGQETRMPVPENLIANTPALTDDRNLYPWSIPAANGDCQETVHPSQWQPAAKPFGRWFDRSVGFWVGGALLGVGGSIFGGSMPYSNSVAVTISVFWWGFYFGCFGASVGALLGLWAEGIPAAAPAAEMIRATKKRRASV